MTDKGKHAGDSANGRSSPQSGIPADLLEILVCPLCKASLDLVHENTGLRCKQCRRVYPIRDDIPVMLINEAKIED